MAAVKHLIAVVGPTAIGKTALAMRLAQHFDCEILSCDSRQFFREMTIGTAVPTAEELALVQHHFIHNKSIFEPYTVGDFEREALALLDRLFGRRDVAVMVGGSGLYVEAVLKGFDAFPETNPTIRQEIARQYEILGIDYLRGELQQRDPDYFQTVDIANPQRMMRALEVCLAAGKPYSSFRKGVETARNFKPIAIGLDAPREVIYDRINRRVDVMMHEGLLDEAKKLYPHRELNALQTVGYRELFEYLDGTTDLETAVSEIKKNTRRFAKRQSTWFRRNPDISWFDSSAIDKIIAMIESKLKS
jgi:tRNA dimethylallyltransferase